MISVVKGQERQSSIKYREEEDIAGCCCVLWGGFLKIWERTERERREEGRVGEDLIFLGSGLRIDFAASGTGKRAIMAVTIWARLGNDLGKLMNIWLRKVV
jgi:hypothetical protein